MESSEETATGSSRAQKIEALDRAFSAGAFAELRRLAASLDPETPEAAHAARLLRRTRPRQAESALLLLGALLLFGLAWHAYHR